MELVIEGLNKLALKTFSGRKISDITVKNRTRKSTPQDTAYVFTIKELPKPHQSKSNGMGKSWEDEHEVWLSKFPNAYGKYEMFVMGLHGVTCKEMEISHIKSLDTFCIAMDVVLERCKGYWQSL
jgi:hypothetical protein